MTFADTTPDTNPGMVLPGEAGYKRQKGPPVDVGPDPLARLVRDRWKAVTDAQAAARRDYWLNLAFFYSEQWIWWDRKRSIVQTLPQAYSPLGPGRTKIIVNRIEFNMISLMARLLKTELGYESIPTAATDDVVLGAKLAEKVLEWYHREQTWESVRYDETFAAFMGGTSAVALEWDPLAGDSLEYDWSTGQIAAGTGDVTLEALNITEFGVEPSVRDYSKARWWVQGVALPPSFVQEYYELGWEPNGDAGAVMSPLQHKLLADQGKPTGSNLTLVLTMYERPHGDVRAGRIVTVVNDRVVNKADWRSAFPFDDLNLTVFRQEKAGSGWMGWTFLNSALPIQFAYNHARSVIQEHMKLTGNARLMATHGAFTEEDFNDDPSSILWYVPDIGAQPPAYLTPPALPRWMTDEAGRLQAELDDIMHVHQTSRGQLPGDRTSGQALALLSESDDEPLGLMAYDQKRGWERIGKQVLRVLGAKATETRTGVLPAARGISEPINWNGKLLRGQHNVAVPLQNVMPKNQAANQAFAKDLWDRQVLTDPRKYARMVGLPPEDFEELLDPDAAQANRENLRMAVGTVEIPQDFEDHAIHIAEHNRWRKSDAYKYASPEVRQIFDHHVMAHEQLAHEQLAQQTQRAMISPALAGVPQAAAPAGSMLPPPAQVQQAMLAQGGGNGSGGGAMPGGGGSPGPALPPGGMAAVPAVAASAGQGGPG